MTTLLRARAAQIGSQVAITVVGGGEPKARISFEELNLLSECAAWVLRDRGVGDGDVVAIALPNSLEFLIHTFGAIKAGATVLPLSARLPDVERSNLLKASDAKVVIGEADVAVDGLIHISTAIPTEPLSRGPVPLRVSSGWKATASGGSTGQPKLILTTTAAVVDDDKQPDYLLPRSSTVLIPGPLFHTAPFTMSVLAVLHGNHLVLQRRFDAAECMELIQSERPEFVLLVPTMMHRIWRLPPEQRDVDISSLRTVFHMAAPCPAWLKEAWIEWVGPDRIYELYGASDSPANTVITGPEWLEHKGSVGKAALGEIQIRDESGRHVGSGNVGEIWMRPPPGRPSRARVVGGDARTQDGWTSVGDLGWMDEDGYLYISDRRVDLILTGGENVYSAEVESVLAQHPRVRSCVVVGLPDEDLGQRVHAIVEAEPEVTEADLRSHMSSLLVRYKTPRSYEFVTGSIRDDAGKVRKSALVTERQ